MKINQISIFLENRTGQLAEIAKLFSEKGVDIKALNIAEASEYGIVRLVVSESEKAYELLKNEGYIAKNTEVTAVAVPDRPGGMYEVVEVLNKADINIEYMYSVLGIIKGVAYMIIKNDDQAKLEKILNENGFGEEAK